MNAESAAATPPPAPELARKLGLFDVTMLVMGSVIGSGIFVMPHVVAESVQSSVLILIAWSVGGLISLAGSLVYAELTRRRPRVGGQYAFLREAYHPAVGFLYGWSLLWIVQSGGMAFVAMVFGRYSMELVQILGTYLGDGAIGAALQSTAAWKFAEPTTAALAIAILTVINCAGVRVGSTTQNVFMILKIVAILTLVLCGLFVASAVGMVGAGPGLSEPAEPMKSGLLLAFTGALVPILFSYGGAHTTTFMAGEVRDAQKTLPRGLVIGVLGVVALYLAVNLACLRALGAPGLAQSKSPASDVMRQSVGDSGALFISVGIAISAIGFLSQASLTSPRVYYAMARDGLFFRSIATVHPKTQVPVMAIVLQGVFAIVIAVSRSFEQIVNYMMSVEMTFFTLTAVSLFILRSRDADKAVPPGFSAWGHPVTTLIYALANLALVGVLFSKDPVNSSIGIGIALAGLPVYAYWRWRGKQPSSSGGGPDHSPH
jgi:basic amino acid/polyamine antiporter, APA family